MSTTEEFLMKQSRRDLARFVLEARSERDAAQRDLWRAQEERDRALAEAAVLRAKLEAA